MADLYAPRIPQCPVHGQMHLRLAADPAPGTSGADLVYVCHGFDGEGCDHIVHAGWEYIGQAENLSMRKVAGQP